MDGIWVEYGLYGWKMGETWIEYGLLVFGGGIWVRFSN